MKNLFKNRILSVDDEMVKYGKVQKWNGNLI